MRNFVATFAPHGANPDGLVSAEWKISADCHRDALSDAFAHVGDAIGKADFAYRRLADNSYTILDTVCGSTKIASMRMVQVSAKSRLAA